MRYRTGPLPFLVATHQQVIGRDKTDERSVVILDAAHPEWFRNNLVRSCRETGEAFGVQSGAQGSYSPPAHAAFTILAHADRNSRDMCFISSIAALRRDVAAIGQEFSTIGKPDAFANRARSFSRM